MTKSTVNYSTWTHTHTHLLWQTGSCPLHDPFSRHVLIPSPIKLYPSVQLYVTKDPRVVSLITRSPFSGAESAPQSTTSGSRSKNMWTSQLHTLLMLLLLMPTEVIMSTSLSTSHAHMWHRTTKIVLSITLLPLHFICMVHVIVLPCACITWKYCQYILGAMCSKYIYYKNIPLLYAHIRTRSRAFHFVLLFSLPCPLLL